MQVIGSIFTGGGKVGDFGWMIRQPEYADALFIFNDNEEQFLAHQENPDDPYGCARGGGNAVIRPYQCAKPPKAAGIPTGMNGVGYPSFITHVQKMVDQAIAAIRALIATGRYQRIYYSAANESGDLGTGIFHVGDDVKRYITTQIKKLATE